MSPPYDQRERAAAARIAGKHPGWYVTWAPWSRRFWAFPLFAAPPGTIVSASDLGKLTARMGQAEAAAAARSHPGVMPR